MSKYKTKANSNIYKFNFGVRKLQKNYSISRNKRDGCRLILHKAVNKSVWRENADETRANDKKRTWNDNVTL